MNHRHYLLPPTGTSWHDDPATGRHELWALHSLTVAGVKVGALKYGPGLRGGFGPPVMNQSQVPNCSQPVHPQRRSASARSMLPAQIKHCNRRAARHGSCAHGKFHGRAADQARLASLGLPSAWLRRQPRGVETHATDGDTTIAEHGNHGEDGLRRPSALDPS